MKEFKIFSQVIGILLITIYFTCMLYEAKLSFFDWSEGCRHTASIFIGIFVGIYLIGLAQWFSKK